MANPATPIYALVCVCVCAYLRCIVYFVYIQREVWRRERRDGMREREKENALH